MSESFFFFFFQAEDGIRDDLVTGVQTCALPISPRVKSRDSSSSRPSSLGFSPAATGTTRFGGNWSGRVSQRSNMAEAHQPSRSEERRVGKEGRSRWSPYH